MKQNLSDRLRAALKATGKTKYRIAQETEMNEGTIGRFIEGKNDMLLARAEALLIYAGFQIVPPAAKKGKAKP